jgi:hypothetical protein
MNAFLQKHAAVVTGVLSGFDRLVFRGTLLRMIHAVAMIGLLRVNKIPLAEFGAFADETSKKVKQASLAPAYAAGRPVIYLASAGGRKDDQAREIAARDGIENGLICVLTAVEPCSTFAIKFNPQTQKARLVPAFRKCLHLYHYFMHPEMGLMHVRLQTWFPFGMQVYLNGREWLARTLTREKVEYLKHGNCFLELGDVARAQTLFDAQLQTDWPALFAEFVQRFNPALSEIFKDYPVAYYWSAHQSEWATDVMFKDTAALAEIYPRLVRHALMNFDGVNVLRFLGRRIPKSGEVIGSFKGTVVSQLKRYPECLRIRHAVNGNSLKLYNKEGRVLRVETTIGNTLDFKVYRAKEGQPEERKSWCPMRRGVADMPRRAEVSQKANERYLTALATADTDLSLGQLLERPCQPTVWKGKRVRALQPTGQDAALLAAIANGAFAINGFRNRDIRAILLPGQPADKKESHRRAGQITRKLRLLRAHGLIQKVYKTQRYQLTENGRTLTAALSAAKHATVAKLVALAA